MKKLLHFIFAFLILLPLAQAAEVTYFIPDASGSPVAAMNEAGTIIWRKHYQPFGGELEPQAANNRVGYTGHVKDNLTGLNYMGARYYDPSIGRFMSMDPAAVNPEDPRTFNRYAYANNNPYRYVDPDGRWAEDIVLGVPSLVLGANSLAGNVSDGNYVSAVVDVIGMVADGAAIIAPGIPGGAGLGIKAIREGSENVAKSAEGIVYKRVNPITGEKYIGQAKSPSRFEARQGEHDLAIGVQHEYEIIGRAQPGKQLDVLEESTIRQNGGIKKRGGELANKRHQMSESRYRSAGGDVDSPY